MDERAIEARLQKTRAELLGGLDAHVNALRELAEIPGFSLDIATDIHPELIDNTTAAGVARLKFWQKWYASLSESPAYTLVRRYSVGTVPGCYGFGQPEKHEITKVDIRIYKGLQPGDTVFRRDDDGSAVVELARPSFHIAYDKQRRNAGAASTADQDEEPSVLFRQPTGSLDFGEIATYGIPQGTEVFYLAGLHELVNSSEYSIVTMDNAADLLPVDRQLSDYYRAEIEIARSMQSTSEENN